MTLSAVFMGAVGAALTFMPDVALGYLTLENSIFGMLLMQLLGALYFAFAMLNWMVKGSLIGGIYNRPVAIANFTHFLIGGLALLKKLIANPSLPIHFWMIGIAYTLLAVAFISVLFSLPKLKSKN